MLFAAAVVAITGCLCIIRAQGTNKELSIPAADEHFNVTFTDMSPMVVYADNVTTRAKTAWTRAYVNSKTWESYAPDIDTWTGPTIGDTGRPDLSNFDTTATWSNKPDATTFFGFVGTGFTIHAYATVDTRVVLQIYSGPTGVSSISQVIAIKTGVWDFGRQGLSYTNQSVGVTIVSGTFYLTGVTLTTALGGPGTTATVQNVSAADEAAKNVNPAFASSGPWWATKYTANLQDSPMASTSYVYVVNNTAALQFDVPKNTSIACLWGVPSPDVAAYNVSISPRSYGSIDTIGYPKSSSLLSDNFLVHMASLDPLQKYTITVNVGHKPGQVDVFGMTHVTWVIANAPNVTAPTGGGSDPTASSGAERSSSGNAGAIGGSIGGGIAALLIIGLLAFFLRRALKRNKVAAVKMRQAGGSGTFEIEAQDPIYEPPSRSGYTEEEMATTTNTVTPFPVTSSSNSGSRALRLSLHHSHREADPLPSKSRVRSTMRTRRPRTTEKPDTGRRESAPDATEPSSRDSTDLPQRRESRASVTTYPISPVSGRDAAPEALEIDPNEPIHQHQDGGRVPDDPLLPIREVPPVYDASWAPKMTKPDDHE